MLSLQDPASREAMRRFWAHWQSDARLAGVKDQSIVGRIAARNPNFDHRVGTARGFASVCELPHLSPARLCSITPFYRSAGNHYSAARTQK
jgi:hypothetical protein